MKSFHIPLIDRTFYIYVGPEEWPRWFKTVIKEGAESDKGSNAETKPRKGSGRCWGSWIWVYDLDNRGCLIHELTHFVCALMDSMNLEEEEMRCLLSAWIVDHVLSWSGRQSAV